MGDEIIDQRGAVIQRLALSALVINGDHSMRGDQPGPILIYPPFGEFIASHTIIEDNRRKRLGLFKGWWIVNVHRKNGVIYLSKGELLFHFHFAHFRDLIDQRFDR